MLNPSYIRLLSVVGVTLLYGILYPWLGAMLGDSYFILVVIPVASVAVVSGWKGGGLAALVGVGIFIPLLLWLNGRSASDFFCRVSMIPACIGTVGVGICIGYFRDLRVRLHRELERSRQAERELREAMTLLASSDSRFRELFDNMTSGVAVYSAVEEGADWVLDDFNTAAEIMLGLQRDKVIGGRLSKLFPPEQIRELVSALFSVWKSGDAQTVSPLKFTDATRSFWLENRIFWLSTGQVVVIFNDRTQEYLAAQRLAESYRLLDTLVNTVPMPLFYKDMQGCYLGCNEAFAQQLFGLSRQEVIGRKLADLTTPQIAELADQEDLPLLENVGSLSFEGAILFADGSKRDVIFNKATIVNEQGQPDGLVGALTDISARKQSEHALREADAKLKATNHEILRYVDMVTHDLKKPLTTLKTVCAVIMQPEISQLTSEGSELVVMGRTAIVYMQELLDDLLLCARMEAGPEAMSFELVDTGHLITEVLERLKPQILAKKVDVVLSATSYSIRADRRGLMTVFMNLIGNAVAYIGTPERPQITIAAEEQGSMLVFSIADNGIGIPSQSIATVFEKFKRGSNTQGISGTGLGLSIVKAAAQAHQGNAWCESELGVGSTFFFSLVR